MSISDLIVVMKDGVAMQIGQPQQVYDDPANLFVAKFLGTPPIHVFDAEVKSEKLYIGSEAVLDVPGVADGCITAAIRPEGFVPTENGALSCQLHRVEVMGRDISVVAFHPACENAQIRAIIGSEHLSGLIGASVRFNLKANKVFLFSKETEERIRF